MKTIAAKHWYLPVSANGRRYSEGFPGGGHNMGHIGSYADLNLAVHPVYSIDMALGDYGMFYSYTPVPGGSGTSTHHPSGWPLGGGAFCRITPPTVGDQGRGIELLNLWRNASIPIQELNVRWEWRGSDSLASIDTSGPKFLIAHAYSALDPTDQGADSRPILFLTKLDTIATKPMYSRDNTLVLGPAQGAFAGYGEPVYAETVPPLDYWVSSFLQFYLTNTLDTGTFQGRPLVEVSEVVTFEMRLISISTPEYPRGLIAYRVYRENGDIFEQGIPWDFNPTAPLGHYIGDIQQFGCGYWNNAPSGSHYMDVGGYITVARNFGGWLGRRSQ